MRHRACKLKIWKKNLTWILKRLFATAVSKLPLCVKPKKIKALVLMDRTYSPPCCHRPCPGNCCAYHQQPHFKSNLQKKLCLNFFRCFWKSDKGVSKDWHWCARRNNSKRKKEKIEKYRDQSLIGERLWGVQCWLVPVVLLQHLRLIPSSLHHTLHCSTPVDPQWRWYNYNRKLLG